MAKDSKFVRIINIYAQPQEISRIPESRKSNHYTTGPNNWKEATQSMFLRMQENQTKSFSQGDTKPPQ
jgi:hypothetical protein